MLQLMVTAPTLLQHLLLLLLLLLLLASLCPWRHCLLVALPER
jgi:hypothetical protein